MTRRTQALRRLPDDARVSIADGFAFPEPPHGERWVVGAVIYDERGRIFIQRRAKARSLFPGAWDLVGGHLEPGESVLDGLLREVREETGWHMTRIVADLGVVEWVGSDGLARLEADYLVEVAGARDRPKLESGKHEDPRWIGPEEVPLDGREPSDVVVAGVVERAFRALGRQEQ